MKKKLMSLICSAVMLCMIAVPAMAESDGSSGNVSGEKAVVTSEDNPDTGLFPLATLSVALAGCVVVVFKKRK